MAESIPEQAARASYPYGAISTALPVLEAVKGAGGKNSPIPKSLLASVPKEDERAQSLVFRIASAKCYGMIEGRSEFALTEAAKRYFFPTNETDRQNALLDFFAAPPAFRELIERFDGAKPPSIEIIGNILHNHARVSESWKERVAGFFLRSAQFIGVIDEAGFLRFNASRHGRIAPREEENTPVKIQAVETGHTAPAAVGVATQVEAHKFYGGGWAAAPGTHDYVLPLPNGRKVLIQAPLDITAAEIKRLQRWIEFTLQVDWSGEKEQDSSG